MSLQLKNIRLSYQKFNQTKIVFDAFDFTFHKQKIYTMIGPSGSGKSTLLSYLAGAKQADSGHATLNGQPYNPAHHYIGLVPQDLGLLPWKTGRQNLEISMKIRFKSAYKSQAGRIETLLEQLDISDLAKDYPGMMSGGQKQRFAIARAFLLDADIVLMDEPFSALDSLSRYETQKLFIETWNRNPVLTVFITHDIEEALLLGHEIIVLNKESKVTLMTNPLGDTKLQDRTSDSRFFEQSNILRKLVGQ